MVVRTSQLGPGYGCSPQCRPHRSADDSAHAALGGSGEFSIGALTARSLAPSSLHLGVKKRTRSEVLAYCRALGAQAPAVLVLKTNAKALMERDKDMATYILEWSEQTTITDLRDVPDDLLDRLPAFDHSKLLTEPSPPTARLDQTEAFTPPTQPDTSFKPQGTGDLFNPLQNVEQRSHRAEEALILSSKEVWGQAGGAAAPAEGELDGSRFPQLSSSIRRKQQLGKLRPEPLVMGLGCWNPEALGTVWGTTGSRHVPVDFNVPLVRNFNLDSWLNHFGDITDQQLVSHIRHGVCSGVQLDHLAMLAPPLLSLADGIESISKELARLVDAGYLRKHSKQPTWPWYTIPNGAVPKAGSDVWRRISDNGNPRAYVAHPWSTESAVHLI